MFLTQCCDVSNVSVSCIYLLTLILEILILFHLLLLFPILKFTAFQNDLSFEILLVYEILTKEAKYEISWFDVGLLLTKYCGLKEFLLCTLYLFV